jgi:hypothetical protein
VRLRAYPFALITLFLVGACADESPLEPADAGSIGQEATTTTDLARSPVAADRTVRVYEVTLHNLTPATGEGSSQVFSPPVIAAHRPSVHMFEVGRRAIEELALIAEDAVHQPMVDRLSGSSKVAEVQVAGRPVPPGGSATWEVQAEAGFPHLSMAFMLVNTNDGFSGVDALKLPSHGSIELSLSAYDAGSEANDELAASIPGPCCGSVGTGTETSEPIQVHPGILGVGDLAPAVYGWSGPVATLEVKRIR